MHANRKAFLLCASALVSGVCNALIGAGGGIILSFSLSYFCKDLLCERKDVYLNAQAAMIPGCLLSCVIYASFGAFDPASFSIYLIPSALGGICGGLLLAKISNKWINKIFAALVIWSGARMILG